MTAVAATSPLTTTHTPATTTTPLQPPPVSQLPSYFTHHWQDDAVAGLGAGLTATLLFHPLELIKTRLQVQRNTPAHQTIQNVAPSCNTPLTDSARHARYNTIPYYKNSYNVVSSVIRHEGVQSLYKGLTPNLIGNVSAWGLYFMLYNRAKLAIAKYRYGNRQTTQLSAVDHLLAASLTGCTIQMVTNPIWVIKTRMFLDYTPQFQPSTSTVNGVKVKHQSPEYRSFFDSFKRIYINEGIPGLYKGILPGLLGVSHGAFQFMAYEQCKRYVDKLHANKQHQHAPGTFTLYYTPFETMCMAAVSKTFAAVITYPYQVVRSRLQDHRSTYTSAADCVMQTYRQEGVRGFYRGLAVNIVKVTPQAITVFVMYESIQSWLKQNAMQNQQHTDKLR